MENCTKPAPSPSDYRKLMRRTRRALSDRQRHQAAQAAMRQLIKLDDLLPKGANIGFYLAGFGELPTDGIVSFCQRRGHQAYLPITTSEQPLSFAPIYGKLNQTPLKKHRLGMYEPVTKPLLAAAQNGCHHLSCGGGGYDRRTLRHGRWLL